MEKEFSDTQSDEEVHQDDIEEDEIDPEYLEYLQNDFQDSIVDEIFYEIADYVRFHALNLCEFMTRDDINVIIETL